MNLMLTKKMTTVLIRVPNIITTLARARLFFIIVVSNRQLNRSIGLLSNCIIVRASLKVGARELTHLRKL